MFKFLKKIIFRRRFKKQFLFDLRKCVEHQKILEKMPRSDFNLNSFKTTRSDLWNDLSDFIKNAGKNDIKR